MALRQILAVLASAALALVAASHSDLTANDGEAEKLHAFIEQGMQEWSLAGLAVAVVKEDSVVFIRGYGVRDIRSKEPIDESTIFQLASCSKPLTATAVALLVQDGTIKWNTPIAENWPNFRVADSLATKQTSLRDILSHRTGIGKDESALYYEMPITRSQLLAGLPELRQAAPFRRYFRCSD